MYITYEPVHHIWERKKGEGDIRCLQPFEKIPNVLPKPELMPSKLFRISDMTVVDATQVNEGYCALSYSWSQSGSIFYHPFHDKYDRIDMGLHKIIDYESEKVKVKYVKFENIIQQICQQFNIRYIWYDQMCINQDDKEEKYREIRKMHNIYSNAYCTVALVPEYEDAPFSAYNLLGSKGEEYFSRLWTLEEAIKSERLLFVGRNTHKWVLKKLDRSLVYIDALIKPFSESNIAQVLFQAHQRTSTKDHDRVFALIHLFPEFMQHIDINYEQSVEELTTRFYGLLAKRDISILLFRNATNGYISAVRKYKFMPSWTGAGGKHVPLNVSTPFQDYDIIGKTMHVTSKFVSNDRLVEDGILPLQKDDLPPAPDDINDDNNKRFYRLCVDVQFPGANETRIFQLVDFATYENLVVRGRGFFDKISGDLKRLSRLMEIKKENLVWYHCRRDEFQRATRLYVDLLSEEDTNDPTAQHAILSEVLFNYEKGRIFYYPVIKKKQGEKYFKVIGCCEIFSEKDIFFGCNLSKQTFLIQ